MQGSYPKQTRRLSYLGKTIFPGNLSWVEQARLSYPHVLVGDKPCLHEVMENNSKKCKPGVLFFFFEAVKSVVKYGSSESVRTFFFVGCLTIQLI